MIAGRLILILTLLLPVATARGDTWEAEDYRGWKISSFAVHGIPHEANDLRRGLALRSGVEFYPKVLARDLARIRLHLARNGYPEARVAPAFEPHREKRTFQLVLRIDPGKPIVVDDVLMEQIRPEFSATIVLEKGSVFRESAAQQSADAIERALKEAGHAFATVTWELESRAPRTVAVRFRADAGEICHFNDTSIDGIRDDLIPVAKRTANVRAGARYRPGIVEEAATNLRLLGLFRLVRVRIERVGPGLIDLVAVLTERKPRSIEWGLGYWTDEGILTRARWEHRNLFRAGRGAAVAVGLSRFRQSGRLSVSTPSLLGTRNHATVAVKFAREDEEAYRLVETGGEVSLRRRPSLISTRTAALSVSNVQIEEKTDDPDAFQGRDGLLSTISITNNRNASDDRLYPTRGSVVQSRVEWGLPGALSESHYLAGFSSGSLYRSIWESVLAIRLTFGAAAPYGDSEDLLPNKRFHAGGAYSMRGFKRRKLGPKDDDGSPLGGEALIESSLEWRFPLIGVVSGAVFLDAGQVWEDYNGIRVDEMEAAVGPGLVIRTPVGPIRGDWAYRLTTRDQTEPRSVFHVIVGNPF